MGERRDGLRAELGLTFIFIAHDLSVVRHISDRVAVMYTGQIMESADTLSLFATPLHPYTRLLLETIPDVEMTGGKRAPVAGEIPNPIDPPSGCPFHPRCPLMAADCRNIPPKLVTLDSGIQVSCHAVIQGKNWRPDAR